MGSEINGLNKELTEKIQYLYKALDECMKIVKSLKEENQILKETQELISLKSKSTNDLSKIRGD